MTREKIKELLPVLQAYAEGKEIQYKLSPTDNWWTCEKCENITFQDDIEYRIKPEEELYTIEQNAGENRIEGGVLSVSGSVSESHYRPFNNCDELKECYKSLYKKKTGLVPIDGGLDVPYIWLKNKKYGTEFLITAFDNRKDLEVGGGAVFPVILIRYPGFTEKST